MRIAVIGCGHGALDKIYDDIKRTNSHVDLVIICGDFQALRNEVDLESMAVPVRHRKLGNFHRYYTGIQKAPVLTIVIGGNHESSTYLSELPYGGWLAPNIYYLGLAGIVNFCGVRIGGVSGIYKSYHYQKDFFETFPLNGNDLRSIYHVRKSVVDRLMMVKSPIDIMISHDWPRGIYLHGDKAELLRKRPFLMEDIDNDILGSPPMKTLMNKLRPKRWFAGHMHVKFEGRVSHVGGACTEFLATGKCNDRSDYFEIVDFPQTAHLSMSPTLKYDREWLAILKSSNGLLSRMSQETQLVSAQITNQDMDIPLNFQKSAPSHDEIDAPLGQDERFRLGIPFDNPQTATFCAWLRIDYPKFQAADFKRSSSGGVVINEDEIKIEEEFE